MIRINLLPFRAARKKENIRKQVFIYVLSVILVGLVAVYYNMHLNGRINSLKTKITSTNVQVAKYKKINKEIAEIKKKLDVLNRKISVIKSLDLDRKAPVQNLDELYQLLVQKRMWYTSLEEKSNTVKIKGVAVDNQTVADYMTRVEKSDRFQNVQLSAIKQKKLQDKGLSLKTFGVDFQKSTKPDETVSVKTKGK